MWSWRCRTLPGRDRPLPPPLFWSPPPVLIPRRSWGLRPCRCLVVFVDVQLPCSSVRSSVNRLLAVSELGWCVPGSCRSPTRLAPCPVFPFSPLDSLSLSVLVTSAASLPASSSLTIPYSPSIPLSPDPLPTPLLVPAEAGPP